MTVAELISFLQSQPKDRLIAYRAYSEYCLLDVDDIEVIRGCEPRFDGWIQSARSDKPTQTYLLLSGN